MIDQGPDITQPDFYDVKGQKINFQAEDVHIVELTADLVDYLLSLNTHNRTPRQLTIENYAKEISFGNWKRTNQGIGVTLTGILSDGQHRLLAVKATGYPRIKIELSTGLDEDAQTVVDVHAKRSQTDVLKLMLNQSVNNSMVAAMNVMFTMREGRDGITYISSRAPTNAQLAEFLHDHGNLVYEITRASGNMTPAAVNGALLALGLYGYEREAIDVSEQLKVGLFNSGVCPIFKLSKKIKETRGKNSNSQRLELYKCAVSACIAHIRGEKLQVLRTSNTWDRLPRPKQEADNTPPGQSYPA